MIRSKHFIFTVLLVSFSMLVSAQKINGVSLVASRDSITSLHVNSVIDVNANYVALMPFGFIKELSSPEIRFNSKKTMVWRTRTRYSSVRKRASKQRNKIYDKTSDLGLERPVYRSY